MNIKTTQLELLELINTYPSPHNGQPMILSPKDDDYSKFGIYFDSKRGLSSTPISYLFSFVTIGVFVRYIQLCAEALGHDFKLNINLPKVNQMASGKKLQLGDIEFKLGKNKPDKVLHEALLFRQTSRKKYSSGLSNEEKEYVTKTAKKYGMRGDFLSADGSQKTIWLNQRAVFDDMFEPKVREELMHWMRFDHKEKIEKKDGLSYDCMELSSGMLKFIFKHYKILRWPILRNVLQKYYLRTMKDSSSVGYIESPFKTEEDAYKVGMYITEIWTELSKENYYLHPFGTIVTNDMAHKDFLEVAGIKSEMLESNYVVFIFRAGKSPKPVKSERLAVQGHLVQKV